MLRNKSTHFIERYEDQMYGGNELWAKPEDAIKAGESIGEELIARFEHHDRDLGDSPQVGKCAHKVLDAALNVVNYAALPTERRVNILRGVIDALAANGNLGGESEWAKLEDETPLTSA